MIEDDAQLEQTRSVLGAVETSLAALRRRVEPVNAALFQAMAEDYVEDILRLRAEVDTYIGTAQAMESRAPLWLALEGPGLSASDVSSRLLSDWLDRLRKSVQSVTDFLQTRRVRTIGRPPASLLAATDLRLVALAEGSIRIGLKLPPASIQQDVFTDETESGVSPRRAVERLLDMALWAESEAAALPMDIFPDHDEAAVVADQLSFLVPSARGVVRFVSFAGSIVPSPTKIILRSAARARLRGLVQVLSTVTEDEVIGTIREIDLDAQRVILRERGPGSPDMRCLVPEDLMPTVEALLDRAVTVRGSISSASPFVIDVISVAPLPDDSAG